MGMPGVPAAEMAFSRLEACLGWVAGGTEFAVLPLDLLLLFGLISLCC